MNILVIGNGFDLAHELPTKYTDFLFFCKIILNLIEVNHMKYLIPKNDNEYENWGNKFGNIPLPDKGAIAQIGVISRSFNMSDRDIRVSEKITGDYFLSNFLEDKYNPQLVKELFYLIYNNIWIEYFLQCDMYGKENWIDFECEISDVIESIDISMDNGVAPRKLSSKIIRLENVFFNNRFTNYVPEYLQATAEEQEKIKKPEISYKELRDILLTDLNKLIRAFEIYLTEFIEKIDIKEKSPDIENIIIQMNQNEDENYILNFNYTHIIQKVYLSRYKDGLIEDTDYIHGEANIINTIKTDNIVLGIGEYLPDDEKDKKTDFIAFKKFYQRIYKGTGSKYKEWLEQIQKKYSNALQNETNFMDMMKAAYSRKEQDDMWLWYMAAQNNNQNKNEIHNLYIFGHSLDVTDGDILRDLILNDNVHTTIFYYNKDVMGQQIANLVKVIGQDELIRRTGGSTKTIEFKQQQDMVPINSQ